MLPLLLLAAAADARLAFFTPSTLSSSLPTCLQRSYHGVYGGQHVFLPAEDCAVPAIAASASLEAGSMVPAVHAGHEIVWVGHAGVAGAPRTAEALDAAFQHLLTATAGADVRDVWAGEGLWAHGSALDKRDKRDKRDLDGQVVFANTEPHEETEAPFEIRRIHASDGGMFLSVHPAFVPVLDTLLPPHIVPVGVASGPVPLAYDIPEHYAKHLANVTRNLRSDDRLNTVVNTISPKAIKKDVRYLTGEDSDIVTRHSFTEGARQAAKWIKGKMEDNGAECHYFQYMEGFSPDVICTYPGKTNSSEHVILSAHYDSRGTFGNIRAPGGDDDGSGSGHLLAIGNAIAEHMITFDRPVTLAFFSGEEEGLYGSHYFAKHLSENNATVILQIQADMLGYRVPGEPMQLGLPESIELPEAGFLLSNLSKLYAPELVVGRTAACCSDHQSFLAYGYPATAVFERNGPIADPMYHNSGDVSDREGYDFEQIASIAKVTMSAILEVAGFRVGRE